MLSEARGFRAASRDQQCACARECESERTRVQRLAAIAVRPVETRCEVVNERVEILRKHD